MPLLGAPETVLYLAQPAPEFDRTPGFWGQGFDCAAILRTDKSRSDAWTAHFSRHDMLDDRHRVSELVRQERGECAIPVLSLIHI